jgi:hypothetical protein
MKHHVVMSDRADCMGNFGVIKAFYMVLDMILHMVLEVYKLFDQSNVCM